MDIRRIFARNLKQLRTEKGFTQESLAHEAGVNRTYIHSLENCRYYVSLRKLAQIAKALKVEPYELLIP